MQRPRTLLWRIGLGLMLVQSAVAIAFGWVASAKLRAFHREQVAAELSRVAPLVADQFEPLLAAPDSAAIQRRVKAIAAETGLRVTVVEPGGTVLGDSDHDPATMVNHRFRPEIDGALTGRRDQSARYSQTVGAEMMYEARAIFDGDRAIGVVRVARTLSVADAAMYQLMRVLGAAYLATLALSCVVVYLVSRRVSRTVANLGRGAQRFASGDLGHRILHPPGSELAMVTEAFNRMADQLQERLAEVTSGRRELEAVLHSMHNGVVALDGQQRVLSMNRAAEAMLNLEGGDVRGRLLAEVVREPELHRLVTEAFDSQVRAAREFTVTHGTRRSLEATCQPLEGARGKDGGLLLVLNDVTQLRRLETIRSDFAANVSHELQTPITAIKGYVETLLDSAAVTDRQARLFLEIVARNADRLAAIVEDLLALSRLEEPGTAQALERTPTRIAPLLESVVGQFQASASEKGIRINRDASAALQARVNPRLLERAVANLLSNAVKYAPRNSTVTLSARSDDGVLIIAVADQGPGIAAEHLPRLFERFYRVDRARSRDLGGTGLGLAIVKHIVIVHGGRVEVESTPGAGSTFRIMVPQVLHPSHTQS
jgi:two-component system phosphate regulon sensor histidine kinase PhoR